MIIDIVLLIIGIIFFILLSGFFSGAETGFISVNRLNMNHRAEKGDERARLASKMLKYPSRILGTTLVGTNISVVSASVLTNILLTKYFVLNEYYVYIISTVGLTFFMLIFSEIIPKTIFHTKADDLTKRIAPFLRICYFLFLPVSKFVNGFSHLILFFLKRKDKEHKQSYSRDDIELLASIGAEDGIITRTSEAFIHSVFSFGLTTAREIMTPLVDVFAIERKKNVNAVVKLIESSSFSRIPVYDKNIYNMIGYISAFDLLHSRKRDAFKTFIHSGVYVPETKKIDSLFFEMRRHNVPLVIVVDEWGGSAGIITYEDIAEFVVGKIIDRGEKVSLEINEIEPGVYLVDAATDVDVLQEKLDLKIKKEGFETVAGFVEYIMQRIPKKNDRVEYDGYNIIVEAADKTGISLVRFMRKSLTRSSKRK